MRTAWFFTGVAIGIVAGILMVMVQSLFMPVIGS